MRVFVAILFFYAVDTTALRPLADDVDGDYDDVVIVFLRYSVLSSAGSSQHRAVRTYGKQSQLLAPPANRWKFLWICHGFGICSAALCQGRE